MKGRKIIFIVTVLAFFTGCGKQSAPVNRQTIDSAEIEKVLTFVREASEKGLHFTFIDGLRNRHRAVGRESVQNLPDISNRGDGC